MIKVAKIPMAAMSAAVLWDTFLEMTVYPVKVRTLENVAVVIL